MNASFPRNEPLPDEFSEPLAHAGSRLGPFARQVLWYSEVASTNDLAFMLAERGAGEGYLVIANAQSAGRGRHGRPWKSPAGAGLYVSTVLQPRPEHMPLLTIAAGVAVAEGIETATGLTPRLKWPNDVYIGERKVAGVLAEASAANAGADLQNVANLGADLSASAEGYGATSPKRSEGGQVGPGVQYVILGIGINVLPAAFPPDIAMRATSLEGELGRPVDRGLLLAECLCALAARYADLVRGGSDPLMDAWRRRAASTFGRPVRWDTAGIAHEGIAENIDNTGALIVRTRAGIERIISGEVRWI